MPTGHFKRKKHECDDVKVYLSAIKDAVSGRVLSAVVSDTNDLKLATDTLEGASGTAVIFHSDQGSIYLSDGFQNRAREMGFSESMSRRGSCWDNAPQESFFGRMKTVILDLLR